MQLKQNNTLRARATMGTNPKESRSSDGIMDQTKKGNKGGSEVAQNKELNMGKQTRGRLVWNQSSW